MQKTHGRDRVPRSQKDQMHDGSKGDRASVVSGAGAVVVEPR